MPPDPPPLRAFGVAKKEHSSLLIRNQSTYIQVPPLNNFNTDALLQHVHLLLLNDKDGLTQVPSLKQSIMLVQLFTRVKNPIAEAVYNVSPIMIIIAMQNFWKYRPLCY